MSKYDFSSLTNIDLAVLAHKLKESLDPSDQIFRREILKELEKRGKK